MVARTYYRGLEPEPTLAHPCHLHGCVDRMHGYTLDDIQRAVRIALYSHAPLAMDRELLHEMAWDGVVECLTETDGHPSLGELTAAGLRALSRAWKQQVHHHGYRPDGDYADDGTGMRGPAFLTYWRDHATPVDPMETRVVEPLAVLQALAVQSPATLRAFAALASADHDPGRAATLAGLARTTFLKQLRAGREAFLATLLDHETPRRQARSVMKDRRRGDRAPCGTYEGYRAHRYRREATCEPCRAANRVRSKAQYDAKKITTAA